MERSSADPLDQWVHAALSFGSNSPREGMGEAPDEAIGSVIGGKRRFRIVPGPVHYEKDPVVNKQPSLAQVQLQANVSHQQPSKGVVVSVGAITPHSSSSPLPFGQASSPGHVLSPGGTVGEANDGERGISGNESRVSPRVVTVIPQAVMATKCARFFNSLIHMSRRLDTKKGLKSANVITDMIRMLIYGRMPAQVFTTRLQQALDSRAQPHLLPFLQQALSPLRDALRRRAVQIEGIDPPPVDTNMDQDARFPGTIPVVINQVVAGESVGEGCGTSTVNQVTAGLLQEGTDSAKDVRSLPHSPPPLINVHVLTRRLRRWLPYGSVPCEQVTAVVSEMVESRLIAVFTRLAVVAEHRLQPLVNHPMYEVIEDTRKQLHFLEELDRIECRKREERERESVQRSSKGRGKERESALDHCKQEAARQKDANEVAIGALGGARGTKRSWYDTNNNPFQQPLSSGISAGPRRVRTKRVTMRDLNLVLAQDRVTANSRLRLRLSLFETVANNAASFA